MKRNQSNRQIALSHAATILRLNGAPEDETIAIAYEAIVQEIERRAVSIGTHKRRRAVKVGTSKPHINE